MPAPTSLAVQDNTCGGSARSLARAILADEGARVRLLTPQPPLRARRGGGRGSQAWDGSKKNPSERRSRDERREGDYADGRRGAGAHPGAHDAAGGRGRATDG